MAETSPPAFDVSNHGLKRPRPRDAGCLVLHRKSGEHFEVLVGRRGSRARFKPGVYVFPGGALESADCLVSPLRSLTGDVARALNCSQRRANAIAMAAVRETYEETGLMFGEPGDTAPISNPSWLAFQACGLTPDLSFLDFLGRAITPTYHSIRYHARFFAANYERFSGELRGNGELEDLRWVRTDRLAASDTTIIQTAIVEVIHCRLHKTVAPAKRLFYKWGRHNFLDI